ncbi:pseudouridine synthase [Spiroplasma alleghenense]|uniref:RNA pseudouridylate synthase n=1 Tax=Spiroplasma alleghenense TaxID=216931 RepID=A0A345Z2F6_9MOLU|nr:RluA family pseudouridine synthase [Spiroplasma alleghenense]AXK50785.1 ribosomal large subunit pseudouridine synthase C [Spiroplasma alleghenense]
MQLIKVQSNDTGQSLFKFIKKRYSDTPLSVIYKWFRTGKIKVNGKKIRDQKFLINLGDEIMVFDTNRTLVRDNFKEADFSDLEIVYEDNNILIVDKPHNLEIHSPINIALDDQVKSYLVSKGEYAPEEENSFVVSHVHRIDKLTRGLVIYAKNRQALESLSEAINDKNKIKKTYWANLERKVNNNLEAVGWIKYDSDLQKAIFQEDEDEGYKKVQTSFYPFATENGNWVEIILQTGRKHQIRATLEYFDNPVVNDFRYGYQNRTGQKSIMLFAIEISFHNLNSPLEYLNDQKFDIKGKIKELHKF